MESNSNIHSSSWVRTIATKGSWYLLSSVFSKGVSFFLIPVYTHYLLPADYGILNSINSVAQLLPIAMSLYLDSAFGRFFHEKKHDQNELSRLFSTVFWFVTINGALVLVVFISSGPLWMPRTLKIDIWPTAYLAFIPVLFLQLSQLGLVFLRQSLDSKRTTFLEISSTILMVGVTLPLLIGASIGYTAKLIGAAVQAVALLVYYVIFFARKRILRLEISGAVLKECLLFSVPLIPNVAGGWITSLSDRLIIGHYSNMGDVGLYSLAAQIGLLLYVLQDSITQVTSAITISGLIKDTQNTKRKISSLSISVWAIMLAADLGLSMYATDLMAILAPRSYSGTASIIGVLGFSYVLSAQYRIYSDIIAYRRKTWVISTGGLIMACCSLLGNILVVPRWGYHASAFVNVTAMFAYTAWIFAWAMKYERLEFPGVRFIGLLLLFGAAIILGVAVESFPLLTRNLIRLVIFVAFSGVAYLIIRTKLKSLKGSAL